MCVWPWLCTAEPLGTRCYDNWTKNILDTKFSAKIGNFPKTTVDSQKLGNSSVQWTDVNLNYEINIHTDIQNILTSVTHVHKGINSVLYRFLKLVSTCCYVQNSEYIVTVFIA